ncbi:MAG: hypothetical protein ACI9EW_003325 [Cellvibrionaceae bacterium]
MGENDANIINFTHVVGRGELFYKGVLIMSQWKTNLGVHLVGSVPLPSSEAVFETVCAAVGEHLRRVPDGETGIRIGWIGFQHDMLEKHPAVMLNPAGRTVPIRDLDGGVSRQNHLFVLNPEIALDEIDFRPLGYAAAAIDSYATFKSLKEAGKIPAGVRFQISLPTPFATGLLYFHPDSQEPFIQLMKCALLGELADICAAIPHNQLAIQWDCCQEILLIEGYFPDDWVYDSQTIPPALGELGDAVPAGAELGYHLCYGSPVDAPLVKQKDMGVGVGLANDIAASLTRPMNFIHMPVSNPTADRAFFAPLADLKLSLETELYLGLLQPKDAENDQRRIKFAKQIVPNFGIATECGWGRKDSAAVPHVLDGHAQAMKTKLVG